MGLKRVGAIFVVSLAVLFVRADGVRAQGAKTPVTVTTGFVFTGGSAAPLMLAEQRGYFAKGGVDINIVRGFGSADVITKVASGTYQAGTGYLPELVRAKAANPDLDAIAVAISYDAIPDAVTALKKSGIAKPGDVAGRRIVAQPNSTSKITFPLFAKAVGLEASTVQWTEVGFELMAPSVIRGTADMSAAFAGSSLFPLVRAGIPAEDIVQFHYSDYQPNLYGNALIVTKSWADKNPAAVRGLVAGYLQGLLDTRRDPAAAIKVLIAREPLLKEESERADLDFTLARYYFTKNVMANGLAYHSNEDVGRFITNIAEPFGLKRSPQPQEIYTAAFLPAPSDRSVK